MVRYNFFCAGFALLLLSVISTGLMAQVSFSPNRLFAGTAVELDSTSAVHWIYVQWYGNGLLTVNGAQTIGTDARAYIVTRVPSKPIAPGGLDSIGVQFAPDIEGVPQAELVVSCTAQNFPSDTLPLFGEGILPHLATAAANRANQESNTGRTLLVNFDSVQMGTDSCMQIVLTNPGSETVAIEQTFFSSHDPDFTIQPLFDTLIPPGGSQTLQVCFTPQQQGFRTATVELRTNIPHTQTTPAQDTSAFFVQFIGTAVPNTKGVLVGFGPTSDTAVVGTKSCWIDTIKNIGAGPATIDSIVIFDFGGYHVVFPLIATFPPFPYVIQPDSIMTFTVCSTPTDTGILLKPTGSWDAYGIEVFDNGGVADYGNPFFPAFYVYGIEIGDTAIVETPFSSSCGPDTETILVLNTENVPEAYTAAVNGGSNPNDFSVVPPLTSAIIPAGAAASFQVVFTPSTTSRETSNLNITGGIPQTVPLLAFGKVATITGSGTAPTALPSGPVETFFDTLTNTGNCEWEPGTPVVHAPFAYVGGVNFYIQPGDTELLEFTFSPPNNVGTYNEPVTFPNSFGFTSPSPVNSVSGTVSSAGVQEIVSSDGYSIGQNYPNPFNGSSMVYITLPAACMVRLSIIDVQGNTVEQVLNQRFDAGTYSVKLDASALPSGTYYYEMQAGGITLSRQMTVVK